MTKVNKKIENFVRNQVNKINEGGLFLLVRNFLLLLLTPLLISIVLFVRLLRPLILIRFGELISGRIGHFAANTEVYLCERDAGIHGQGIIDIFYINSSICNRQLKKMWDRVLSISHFAAGLDLISRVLPGGDKHIIPWREDQDRDIHGVLESTKVHISFTSEEERLGQLFLKQLGITDKSPFVCFLSRDPAYLDTRFPKGNWHYHDHRDSSIKNFIPAAEELTRRGYFALRMGAVVNENLNTKNSALIDYAAKHRTEFLDMFLGAKCCFYLGDSCGYSAVPMMFKKPLAIVNMIPLEYTVTWSSDCFFIPKKLWLRKERRFLSFQEMLGSKIGRFGHTKQYEQLGIEVIENTSEEITALAVEMDQRLKGNWQTDKLDEDLQQHFWALFKPNTINKVFRSRIGAEFLRQNKELLG